MDPGIVIIGFIVGWIIGAAVILYVLYKER